MKITRFTAYARHGLLALGLWLGATSIFAAAPSAPFHTNTAPAPAAPAQTALTPAAPVASPVLLASEDIRDIRQPRHVPTHRFWTVVAAGVITLIALGLALRWWLYHGKFFETQPHEIALQYLDEARRLIDPDRTREYCFEVSQIIRRYIEDRFHIQAPQLTTEEFLRELTVSPDALLAAHRALLAGFLQHCDLAKFAGWYYCRPDLEAMHLSAEEFVRQTIPSRSDTDPNRATAAPGKNPDTLLRRHLAEPPKTTA
ncbi:MAG TPA: hypothetical protein VMB80_16470 [Candidatus Acidoferrum sp.]|nr:hypothetical protein [Candidatus Acidoferrum sp.]